MRWDVTALSAVTALQIELPIFVPKSPPAVPPEVAAQLLSHAAEFTTARAKGLRLDPRYSGRRMGRKPKDDDATQNLKPEDKTQRAKEGTKLFPR